MRQVPVTKESNYCLDVDEAVKVVDENTIAVVAIMGSTFTGHFEPVKVNPKEEGERGERR
jgi:glutamate decarboxylase